MRRRMTGRSLPATGATLAPAAPPRGRELAALPDQVEACAEAGPALLADAGSPLEALRQWIDLVVDFPTKHGLANALQSDNSGFGALHAYELMRGIGSLCIGRDSDPL